jgi:hypothetical protein
MTPTPHSRPRRHLRPLCPMPSAPSLNVLCPQACLPICYSPTSSTCPCNPTSRATPSERYCYVTDSVSTHFFKLTRCLYPVRASSQTHRQLPTHFPATPSTFPSTQRSHALTFPLTLHSPFPPRTCYELSHAHSRPHPPIFHERSTPTPSNFPRTFLELSTPTTLELSKHF